MRTKIISIIICLSALIVAALSCRKNSTAPTPLLSPSDVYIREAALTDTLSQSVSVEKDSIVTVQLRAALKGNGTAAFGTHAVVFAIDTTQIAAYRSKYGPATLLPQSNYLLAFNTSVLSDTGATLVNLNIAYESSLLPGTTYVLPVVIKSIDDQTPNGLDSGQVLYLLVKTLPIDYGVPISKVGWNIVRFSSQHKSNSYPVSSVLDGNLATFWWSDFAQIMPQYVTIDMAQQYDLKAVTFNYSPAAAIGSSTPTQIMIELSKDTVTWTNAGTYSLPATATVGALRQLKIRPITPARYIRFTVLQVTVYPGSIYAVALSEIGANN